MFNLRLCNAATIRYSQLKFGHMHLCGMDYKYFSPHCCKCNSFGCTAAIKCGNACLGPHSYSLYSGSEHSQFNSPRLVKCEAGFPNPRRALIGSNQLWRVNDSPYYREYCRSPGLVTTTVCVVSVWSMGCVSGGWRVKMWRLLYFIQPIILSTAMDQWCGWENRYAAAGEKFIFDGWCWRLR